MVDLFFLVTPIAYIILGVIAIVILLMIRTDASEEQKRSFDFFIMGFLTLVFMTILNASYFIPTMTTATISLESGLPIWIIHGLLNLATNALFYMLLTMGLLKLFYGVVRMSFSHLLAAILLITAGYLPWIRVTPIIGDGYSYIIYPLLSSWHSDWGAYPQWHFTMSTTFEASVYVAFVLSALKGIKQTRIQLALGGLVSLFSSISILIFADAYLSAKFPRELIGPTPAFVLPVISIIIILYKTLLLLVHAKKAKEEESLTSYT